MINKIIDFIDSIDFELIGVGLLLFYLVKNSIGYWFAIGLWILVAIRLIRINLSSPSED